MTKERRQALLMTALSLFFSAKQLMADPQSLNHWNLILSLLIPIVGIIFSLNDQAARWCWGLALSNLFLFLFMLAITFKAW